MQCEKRIYANKVEAIAACAKAKADFQHSGKAGKSWRRLQAYKCQSCPYFHIGRANKLLANYRKPQPAPKLPSFGELRRKAERMEREWIKREDYQRRKRAAAIGKLIEADRAIEEAKAEYSRVAREVTAMFLPETLPVTAPR